MFRKLFQWALAALMVVLVVAGCSKKPTEYVDTLADNYAPSSIATYPDTVQVTVKWVRNAEAEAQGGFGGYYVYCTSRSLTYYGGATDSVVGLAQLPAESLAYFQVAGSPFSGVDQAVVTHSYDPLTESAVKLRTGTKYYFYVRTMVDGQLSWAANWSWSSPRPEGDASIFAFVPFDTLAGDSGLYGALELQRTSPTITPILFRTPITTWKDTLIDSTQIPPVTTIGDSAVCGYLADTLCLTRRSMVDSSGTIVIHRWNYAKKNIYPDTVGRIDIIAKKISATQVQLQSPMTNTAIPVSGIWGTTGKENLIQALPGGWAASTSVPFLSTSYIATVSVGESGTTYQFYTGGYYVKIRIDSVTVHGNSIKVTFHYAYQLVPGVKSF